MVRDEADDRRRDHVAEEVNDEDVDGERRGPRSESRDVRQDRVRGAGVEEEEEDRDEQHQPAQREGTKSNATKNGQASERRPAGGWKYAPFTPRSRKSVAERCRRAAWPRSRR